MEEEEEEEEEGFSKACEIARRFMGRGWNEEDESHGGPGAGWATQQPTFANALGFVLFTQSRPTGEPLRAPLNFPSPSLSVLCQGEKPRNRRTPRVESPQSH